MALYNARLNYERRHQQYPVDLVPKETLSFYCITWSINNLSTLAVCFYSQQCHSLCFSFESRTTMIFHPISISLIKLFRHLRNQVMQNLWLRLCWKYTLLIFCIFGIFAYQFYEGLLCIIEIENIKTKYW